MFDFGNPQTTSAFAPLFKEVYDDTIYDLIYNKTFATRLIDHERQETGGKGFFMKIRTGRNLSFHSIAEMGELPAAQHQRYAGHRLQTKLSAGRLALTNDVFVRARSDPYSFANSLDSEVKGLAEDARFVINRIICAGDGSGRLAQINGAPAVGALTYTLDNPGGRANEGPGTQFMDTGMIVGAFDEVSQTLKGSAQVMSVDHAAQTVTLSHTIAGASDNDYLYMVSKSTGGVPGSLAPGSWNYFTEQVGFFGHINDEDLPGPGGTTRDLQDLDAATNPTWQAPVISNGGDPWNLSFLDQARDVVAQRANGNTDVWLTTYGIRRKSAEEMVANRRYIDVMNLEGGWRAITHDGIPIIPEKMMLHGHVLGIDRGSFLMCHEGGFHWLDGDGTIMRLANGGEQLIWTATLVMYWELAQRARCHNIKIIDIPDPV